MHRFSTMNIPHQNLLSLMDLQGYIITQNPQFTLGFILPTGSNSAQNMYWRKTQVAWLLAPNAYEFQHYQV